LRFAAFAGEEKERQHEHADCDPHVMTP